MVCLLIGCTREQLENREFKNKELGKEWWYYKGRNNTLIPFNDDSKRSSEDLIKLTPRKILQLLGTECGRQIIHPNIWINALFTDYKYTLNKGSYKFDKPKNKEEVDTFILENSSYPNWCITDVRFPDEIKAIHDRGGIVIRLERFTSIKNDLVYFKNDSDDAPINGIYRILEVKKDNCTLIDDKTGYSFGAWFEEISKINEHESETALDNYQFDYVIENNSDIQSLIEKVKIILEKENIL